MVTDQYGAASSIAIPDWEEFLDPVRRRRYPGGQQERPLVFTESG